jgi:hypothetical protein
MTELDFEYLRDVLDNITYWDTCPDKDKQRLRLLVKQIDEHREQVKKLNIDDVSKQRELLIAFYANQNGGLNDTNKHSIEREVDNFLSNL